MCHFHVIFPKNLYKTSLATRSSKMCQFHVISHNILLLTTSFSIFLLPLPVILFVVSRFQDFFGLCFERLCDGTFVNTDIDAKVLLS